MNLETRELVVSLYSLAVWSGGDRTKFRGALQDAVYNVLYRAYNSDFKEADHPRDADGKRGQEKLKVRNLLIQNLLNK